MSMPKNERAPCWCGEERLTDREVTSQDKISGERFVYRTCLGCGTERIVERPTASRIGSFYPDDYTSHTIRSNGKAERLKRLLYRVHDAPENTLGPLRPLARLILRPLRGFSLFAFRAVSPRRVYEFGAASGNDLDEFRRAGWEIGGCEPSAGACAKAASRGITLDNTTAEAATLPADSVSCVVINNVLEHVHDPALVLSHAFKGLLPSGSIVLVVPNHRSLGPTLFAGAWPGYDGPRHLWGVTPASLSALLRRTGFTDIRIYHRFQGLWAWRSSLDGRHASEPVAAWRVRFAQPLALLLFPIGVVGAMCGFGDFITVVAEKPTTPG